MIHDCSQDNRTICLDVMVTILARAVPRSTPSLPCFPHHQDYLSLAMHRPEHRHRLCLKKKIIMEKKGKVLAIPHLASQASYKW